MSRKNLPYRGVAECFLLYRPRPDARPQLVAQDGGKFLKLPGGGIDPGETPEQAARREVREEIGASLRNLHYLGYTCWDWHPGWANNAKRRERYRKFRGEKVHFLLGEVRNLGQPTSDEGDEWVGQKMMSLRRAADLVQKYWHGEHPNAKEYKMHQLIILRTLIHK